VPEDFGRPLKAGVAGEVRRLTHSAALVAKYPRVLSQSLCVGLVRVADQQVPEAARGSRQHRRSGPRPPRLPAQDDGLLLHLSPAAQPAAEPHGRRDWACCSQQEKGPRCDGPCCAPPLWRRPRPATSRLLIYFSDLVWVSGQCMCLIQGVGYGYRWCFSWMVPRVQRWPPWPS
jgi:hypothetical protein